MEHLVQQYGYLAVLVGTIVEGGTLLTMAGLAAHHGWLQLVPWVIAAGALGNLIDGQLWFLASRHWGLSLARRRASWRKGLARLDRLYHRWPQLMVVAARFVPGVRTASYIAAGLTRISAIRYAVLNVIGAVLWATCIASVGYFFGEAMQALAGDVHRIERPVFVVLALIGVGWWLWDQVITGKDAPEEPPDPGEEELPDPPAPPLVEPE